MIRTDKEYKQSQEQLSEIRTRLEAQKKELESTNLSEEQIQRVLEPEEAFCEQLQDEVTSYDRLRRHDANELVRYSFFNEFGKLLIALRIFSGISQAELASELGVDPSQVSRDERNEYHGISISRAQKILTACKASLRMVYEPSGAHSAGVPETAYECV